jgi:hypothetical protein
LVDMKLFAELVRIETALVEKQSVAEALAWCGENRGTLKKTKVRFYSWSGAINVLIVLEQSGIHITSTRVH